MLCCLKVSLLHIMDRINSKLEISDYEYEDDFGDDYDDYEEIIYEVKLY